jgi:hypothetical protein
MSEKLNKQVGEIIATIVMNFCIFLSLGYAISARFVRYNVEQQRVLVSISNQKFNILSRKTK